MSTADDVTVLAANTGLLQGRVYQDSDNDGIFNPSFDTSLAAIDVTITDATSTMYTVSTDANGYFSRVVAAGNAIVDVDNVGLPPGLVLEPGFSDPSSVAVPNGATVKRDTAYVVAATSPDLLIVKTHGGNFSQGQLGASYTLTVSNIGGGPSAGQITVTDSLPAGLTATALSGSGWSCDVSTVTCARNDALGSGAGYPAITLTVNVAANASASVTNTATIAGGGDTNAANNTASDVTTVTVVAQSPDLSITKTHAGNFSQGQAGATYAISVTNIGIGPSAGTVTVADALPAGLTATAITDSGWSRTFATLTCTRSDPLTAGSSYPVVTVTINVAASAAASVTNTATVSGGGDTNVTNNTASDNTTVTVTAQPPDLSITKTHVGTFTQGQVGAMYTITVTNVGNGPTAGQVTVAELLPAGLTATAFSGAGWTCTLAALACTRSDTLNPGASYPSMTVSVNVAANAPASITNIGSVSGGGDTSSANNASADMVVLNAGTIQPVPVLNHWLLVLLSALLAICGGAIGRGARPSR